MAYFPDESRYLYADGEAGDKNVGWLDGDHTFPVATPSEEFLVALARSCRRSVRRTRGLHRCELCRDVSSADWPPAANVVHDAEGEFVVGGAEIRVRTPDGVVFAAPDMVIHYVAAHDYCPPEAFRAAVLADPSLME